MVLRFKVLIGSSMAGHGMFYSSLWVLPFPMSYYCTSSWSEDPCCHTNLLCHFQSWQPNRFVSTSPLLPKAVGRKEQYFLRNLTEADARVGSNEPKCGGLPQCSDKPIAQAEVQDLGYDFEEGLFNAASCNCQPVRNRILNFEWRAK